jgi:hypothetical protein
VLKDEELQRRGHCRRRQEVGQDGIISLVGWQGRHACSSGSFFYVGTGNRFVLLRGGKKVNKHDILGVN